MKSPSQSSFLPGRSTLIAASVAVILGTASAVAQTSSGASGAAGATSAGSSQKNPSTTTSTSSDDITRSTAPSSSSSAAAGNTLNTGAAADVDSTKEINAQSGAATSIGAGAATGRETISSKLGWMERRWVHKVADDGKAEVQIAQLATERASNPEVKAFAQKMVDDHTKVNEELMGIASQKNVKLDDDDDQDRSYKRLSKKSGMEFDREFVEHMIDEHEKDVKMFEKAAKDAKDSELRAFASKHVDDLREHLQQAQGLRQSVMPTGRTDDYNSATSSSSSRSTDDANKARQEETGSQGATSPSSSYSPGTSSSTSPANDDTSRSGTTKRDGSR